MKETPVNFKYFLMTAFAVLLTFELHELCHYLVVNAWATKWQ